jgi:hypothetical protein
MLVVPHKCITAEYVKRKRRNGVHPGIFAKAAMAAIVHNIKSDC